MRPWLSIDIGAHTQILQSAQSPASRASTRKLRMRPHVPLGTIPSILAHESAAV